MELNNLVRIFGKYIKLLKIYFRKFFQKSIFAGKDISKVVDSKTGALVFIGGNAFNYTVDAAGTVSSGLGQAGDFINGITIEGLENGTIK